MKRLVARYPNDLALAPNSAQLEKAMKAGKIAGMLGLEGGHSIGSSLAVLRQMYDLGARYLTMRSAERRVWKACVRKRRSRWSPSHYKKKHTRSHNHSPTR